RSPSRRHSLCSSVQADRRLRRPAMAPLADLRRRQRRAFWCLSVAAGVACGSVAWLFGAVGPAQPDQAVLAKVGVAVQGPSSAEGAAVAEACPVAAVQSAQRSDRERARAGAAASGHRVGSWLVSRSRAGLEGPILCCGGVGGGAGDPGGENDRAA